MSAVEFALLAPPLIAIPIPVLDIGLGLYTQMQVKEAAQAGAQYALLYSYDTTALQTAVKSATPLNLTASDAIETHEYCGCPSGTSITFGDLGSCGACAGGGAAGNYVTVKVSVTYSPPVAYPPLIKDTYTLTSTSTLRVK